MRLPLFIDTHMDQIMAEWVAFARTLDTSAEEMTLVQLRDHAAAILRAIARDIESHQSSREQYDKSRGNGPEDGVALSAASDHGTERYQSHFTLLDLSAEFRALRATVLRLWLPLVGPLAADSIYEMVRFNEAIDQALAESIVTYSARSDQTRELFLAILGHDLRAPLATLALSGTLLTKPELPAAEVQKVGARVRRSALVMSAMVEDLIGYTRTQLGSGMPIVLSDSDLGDACRSAIEDAQSTVPGSRFELEAQGDLRTSADSVRLHQLLTNLLVNAVKYGTVGEPVRVRAIGNGDELQVHVNNHGPVIPRSAWRSIFEPLVRLPAASTDAATDPRTSLGLGLYVAREIATLHGGSIELDSTEEAGTTFSVRLPRAGEAA